MVNTRRKGMSNELKTQKHYEDMDYYVQRFYQPIHAKQGALDMLAISKDGGEIVLIQSKTNTWGDIRPIKNLAVQATVTALKVVVRYDDRKKEPKIRILPAREG